MAILIASSILVGKVTHLQMFNSDLQERARKTTLQKRTIHPSRGLIYDRHAEVMVINESLYDLEVVYNELDPEMDTTLFCNLLQITKEEFLINVEKNWKSRRYRKSIPFTFLKRISPKTYSKFHELQHRFPGFYPVLRNVRSYPHENAAHLLGYLGEVDRNKIEKTEGKYKMGDYIGISGLENVYEDNLRGTKGVEYFLKDNLGRPSGTISGGDLDSLDAAATMGVDIVSTIDLKLQQYGEYLMQNKKGSIVAIEPKTGEILSMISSPTYDPNLLRIDRNRSESVRSLATDTINQPFIDRSVMARYPPGSIFKPILGLIAMQEGITPANRTIRCDGSYEINTKGQSQGCRDHPTPYNIGIALQYSCNTYFYQTIRDLLEMDGYTKPYLGLDRICGYLYEFGLGNKLGVDISHENSGFIPTSEYYNKLYNTKYSEWRSTYILSLGIGQGELQLTTLQMANLAAIMANRGYYYLPHLLKSFKDTDNTIPSKFIERKSVSIDSRHFGPIIDGMEKVINAGTGYQAYLPGVPICGKTGTSQNPSGEDHSVFFAFAPKQNPQIAIAVYVENAGGGGQTAAPIASLMIEKYLQDSISINRSYLENRLVSLDLIKYNL